MQTNKEAFRRILDTCRRTSGIGLLGFDTELNLIASCPEELYARPLTRLITDRALSALAEIYAQPPAGSFFYTCFLHEHILCNLVVLVQNENYVGAVITEPLLVKAMSEQTAKELVAPLGLPPELSAETLRRLTKGPVTPHDQVAPLGSMLYSLSKTLLEEEPPRQVILNTPSPPSQARGAPLETAHLSDYSNTYMPMTTYLRFRKALQDGSMEDMLREIDAFRQSGPLLYSPDNAGQLSALRNTLIRLSTLACFTAIDSNVPYGQCLNLSDDTIRQAMEIQNMQEFLDRTESALLAFTRLVSIHRGVIYSGPVRKAMDYLRLHYAEKVALEKVAEQAGISLYYMSTLIKTETGLSFMDNLNKIRVSHAKKLMLDKNSSILDIAQQVGFQYQNHFASVFKKFTGQSPTAYRKSLGLDTASTAPKVPGTEGEILDLAIQQMQTRLTLFSGTYDMARLVNPLRHISWVIYEGKGVRADQECYRYWNRNASCENCISSKAYLHNDMFFKVEQRKEQLFLVLSFPQSVGKTVYVAEIIKDITGRAVLDMDQLPLDKQVRQEEALDALTGLYSRRAIDARLPQDIRRSAMEHVPMTLLLATVEHPNETDSQYDSLLRNFAHKLQKSVLGPRGWAGRYSGNTFLLLLWDASEEDGSRLADSLLKDFADSPAHIRFAAQPLTGDIKDAPALLYLGFARLYGAPPEAAEIPALS